jgi:hypothetical protein
MEVQTKIYELKSIELKEEGSFVGVFATLNVEDSQGDVTLPGAFGEQNVVISQYNHGSWGTGVAALPIGVGKIYERGEEAIVEGEFDMSDDAAVKTYKKMLYVKSKGRVQEFSYALPEIDWEMREVDGRRQRMLKKIRVNEVSPVLMGAGVNTRLLDIKAEGSGLKLVEHIDLVVKASKNLAERLQSLEELRRAEGKSVSEATLERLPELRDVMASVLEGLGRVSADPEAALTEFIRFQKHMAQRRS